MVPRWLRCKKYKKAKDLTVLTANKPSLTALQNPGISPGQEVLFPDPEWPLHAFHCRQELEHTSTGEKSLKLLWKKLWFRLFLFFKNSDTYSLRPPCRTTHGTAESCWLSKGGKLAEKILDSAAPSFPVISKDSKMIPSRPPVGPLFSFTVRGLQRLFRSIIHRRSDQRCCEIRVITGGRQKQHFSPKNVS